MALPLELTNCLSRGLSETNVLSFRRCYQAFSDFTEVQQTVSAKLTWSHFQLIMKVSDIPQDKVVIPYVKAVGQIKAIADYYSFAINAICEIGGVFRSVAVRSSNSFQKITMLMNCGGKQSCTVLFLRTIFTHIQIDIFPIRYGFLCEFP